MGELINRPAALAWQLRAECFRGHEIAIRLEDGTRVRGYVVGVAATGAYADIDDGNDENPLRVPVANIAQVRRPHYHEDALDAVRRRLRPRTGPDPFPGQLRLGGEAPEVSRRSRAAVERAAAMLAPQDLMDTLAALDRAVYRRSAVPTVRVAREMNRTPAWTVRRLGRLAEMQLAEIARERRRYVWRPARG